MTAGRPLRIVIAGAVDDGKSTLIGRLLLDCGALLADQQADLRLPADPRQQLDLARATDGLEAERAQGITIDVAHRSLATPRRRLLLADAPGHEQYTRNMVTAAAGADAAVILVDPTKLDLAAEPLLLLPQTRRHTVLARLVGVRALVFAVNKLDAVADAPAAFERVRAALQAWCAALRCEPAAVLPISALRGDNVVQPAGDGPSLLEVLERLPAAGADPAAPLRLPVQYIARHPDGRRVLWGRIERGHLQVGDSVLAQPLAIPVRVQSLWRDAQPRVQAQAGESIGVLLDAELDLGRGDWLMGAPAPALQSRGAADLAWLDTEAAVIGRRYELRHGHRWTCARLTAVCDRLNLDDLQRSPAAGLAVNEIGAVELETDDPLPLEPFVDCAATGAFILVDRATLRTAAVGFVRGAA
jgi:sulfate adenylyltransferase subunit 1